MQQCQRCDSMLCLQMTSLQQEFADTLMYLNDIYDLRLPQYAAILWNIEGICIFFAKSSSLLRVWGWRGGGGGVLTIFISSAPQQKDLRTVSRGSILCPRCERVACDEDPNHFYHVFVWTNRGLAAWWTNLRWKEYATTYSSSSGAMLCLVAGRVRRLQNSGNFCGFVFSFHCIEPKVSSIAVHLHSFYLT